MVAWEDCNDRCTRAAATHHCFKPLVYGHIQYLGVPILVHKHIGEFDVPVSDWGSAGVQILDSRRDLQALGWSVRW